MKGTHSRGLAGALGQQGLAGNYLASDVWTSDHAEPGRNGAQLYSEVREVDARRRRFRHGPMTRGRSKARRKFFECHINYTAMSKRRVQTSESASWAVSTSTSRRRSPSVIARATCSSM